MLKIIPIGGLGEIGLNMMIFEYADTLFVVDCGLMFPEDDMLGINYVIPDMSYLRQNGQKAAGIILTHAHEDHIGALPFLLKRLNLPVYGTPFTLGVVANKLEDHGLLKTARLHEIRPGQTLSFAPFQIDFLRVNHSIVDGVGLAITTPEGLVVHSGDFKISHSGEEHLKTDLSGFARCGEKGVLALLSDSTNVEKEGYTVSDQQIGQTIASIAAGCEGRVIIALFASAVTRIQKIVEIAHDLDRKVIFHGMSIENNVRLAKQLGFIQIAKECEIDIEQAADYPDDRIMIITTGSQGEPMAALARMASGSHRQVQIQRGDTVILSSKFIPGNERSITKIINALYRSGANVIYEKISEIHVSGHAFKEELKIMISLTRPRYFIPIHGEHLHLVLHARLAESMGLPRQNVLVIENGIAVAFDSQGAQKESAVTTGRVLIDGKGVGDVGPSVLNERRRLSKNGLVIVNMILDKRDGAIIFGPEIVSKGFVFKAETGHLLEDAVCVALEIVEEIGPDAPRRVDQLKTKIRTALKQFFYFTIQRRPIILPFILEV